MSKFRAKESTEQVAGDGLLHRRALLGRGLAFAGAVGASGVPTGAAAAAGFAGLAGLLGFCVFLVMVWSP
jgi:hypothetical protein